MDRESKAVIDLVIKSPEVTKDVLKAALQELLSGKSEKKGNIRFGELFERQGGKLESIEVSNDNIGDFLATAAKYDIDFSLKKDSTTQPPTFHVFFGTRDSDNFKRAFTEYAVGVSAKAKQKQPSIPMQTVIDGKAIAEEANQQLNKDKVREKVKHESL